jgi:hypothetical protein
MNWRNVMSSDLTNRSDDEVVREVSKPIKELLSKADEELKKVDELMAEAERKRKAVYDPGT